MFKKPFAEIFAQYISRRRHVKDGKCQKVLGNTGLLSAFAVFWKTYGDALEQVTAVKLHEFTANEEYTKGEIEAYKRGLATLPLFFFEAWQETEENAKKANIQAEIETA